MTTLDTHPNTTTTDSRARLIPGSPPVRLLAMLMIVAVIVTATLVVTRGEGSDAVSPSSGAIVDTDRSDLAPIAEFARDNGLTGLSPASMAPTGVVGPQTFGASDRIAAGPGADLVAIAEFARAHGLTGLSPASLGSVDD